MTDDRHRPVRPVYDADRIPTPMVPPRPARTPVVADPRKERSDSPIPQAPLPKFGPTPQQIFDAIKADQAKRDAFEGRVDRAIAELVKRQDLHSTKIRRAAGDSQKFEKVDTQLAQALVALEDRLQAVETSSKRIEVDNATQTKATLETALATTTLTETHRTERWKTMATMLAALLGPIVAAYAASHWPGSNPPSSPPAISAPHTP